MRSSARASDDTSALLGDLIRFGTIETADLDAREYVVRIGDVLTPPIRRMSLFGNVSLWTPLSEDEQVALLCAEGDIEHALIIGSLESDEFPSPGSGNLIRLKLPDGSTLTYDPEAKTLTLDLKGAIILKAPDGFKIEADVDITGKVTVSSTIDATGVITSQDDVKAGDIRLKTHKHGNVSAGMAKTGPSEA